MARRTRIGRMLGLLGGRRTLANLWDHLGRTYGDRVFLTIDDSQLIDSGDVSFAQMRNEIATIADALRSIGVEPGDRV